MRPFVYTRPPDVDAAVTAGTVPGALFLGGGTNVVDLMKLGVMTPASLVDVSRLSGGAAIEETPQGLRIAASARNSDVAAHPLIQRRYPVLSEALLSGASPQIRNMATVAGNLLQRTRCAYFRDVAFTACNKRSPESGCAAMAGWTRMHAIIGVSDRCIAAHPSDMNVALAVLDAGVYTHGPKGERSIAIADFHTEPGLHPEVETVLQPGELITGVTLPATPFAARSAYVKVRDRAAFAFALVSAAAALDVEGTGPGRIRQARVAIGGASTKPWRCRDVENALAGQPPSRAVFDKAAALAVRKVKTTPDNAFKVGLVQRAIVRALERALETT
ncbi:MAG TPA: xanthine dehydrogenase family protein subunit M [Polyangia bacterium]|nr:xanthine dehydrogenase family protein subunit M [Polyangia bacterium]